MASDVVATLRRLVSIPSANPMGAEQSGPEYGESRLTEYLESAFDELGIGHRRQSVHPGRDNLIARVDGPTPCDRGGQLILFAAHQDTVPVEGMTVEPFSPVVREGRLFGRGACDVKGGMAAMLAAVERLVRQRPKRMPTVVMACTVNEENGFTGAEALAELCQKPDPGIIPGKPDAAIVAEPTDLDVVVAHKGVVRWRCHTVGRAGHSARPEDGDNAIYKMGRVVQAIERYHGEVVGSLGSHPLCGDSTVSVGTIRGGISVNTIPDHCTIEIDRRLCPQEDAHEAYRHLVDYLAGDTDLDIALEHDPPYMRGLALSQEANGPLAEQLADVVRQVAGPRRKLGVPYATDAGFLAAVGIPTVVFGPGSIQQAHTQDEWVSLDQVQQAAEVLYRFASGGLTG